MKKLPLLLLAGLLICGFSACTSTSEIIAGGLKVELTRIERGGDGAVHVTWRVGNPNVVSYLLSKCSHKITLNGTVVGTVVEASPLGVPAQNQVERTGVLVTANPAARPVIDQAVAQGSATYRMDSDLFILIVDEKIEKAQLTGSGTVPVK